MSLQNNRQGFDPFPHGSRAATDQQKPNDWPNPGLFWQQQRTMIKEGIHAFSDKHCGLSEDPLKTHLLK